MHRKWPKACQTGTSKRRYGSVRLVEVPEAAKAEWLAAIRTKGAMNPLLAQQPAISHTGPLYATLTCTHFVEAHKIIAEGHRHYRDQPEQLKLDLNHDDQEGSIIQQQGVNAIVYSEGLWNDIAAITAIMREDNLDAEIAKSETELDAFGTTHHVVNELIAGYPPHSTFELSTEEVMEKVEALGLGNCTREEWKNLVTFRLVISEPTAAMLLNALFQVVNGRMKVPAKTYGEIANILDKRDPWPKVFLLMQTYTDDLLSEEKGTYAGKGISHTGPHATTAKILHSAALKELALETETFKSVTKFFHKVYKHYERRNENGASEEKKMLANAILMKALGRLLWNIAHQLYQLKVQRNDQRKKGHSNNAVIGDSGERRKTVNKNHEWQICKDRESICYPFGECRCLQRRGTKAKAAPSS